jgi:hypothetical protein
MVCGFIELHNAWYSSTVVGLTTRVHFYNSEINLDVSVSQRSKGISSQFSSLL